MASRTPSRHRARSQRLSTEMLSPFALNAIVLAFANGDRAPELRQSADRPAEQHARPGSEDPEDHRRRIAGVLGQAVFRLVLWPSEPCACPHLHRRRAGAETGAERRDPRPLVVEADVHRRRAAIGDHASGLRGVSQPHYLKILRAPRTGDSVAAEHHKFCAAVGAGRGRPVGGCGEPRGRGLAVVAIASGDDKGVAPGADLDRAAPAPRNVVWICLDHVTPSPLTVSQISSKKQL